MSQDNLVFEMVVTNEQWVDSQTYNVKTIVVNTIEGIHCSENNINIQD